MKVVVILGHLVAKKYIHEAYPLSGLNVKHRLKFNFLWNLIYKIVASILPYTVP